MVSPKYEVVREVVDEEGRWRLRPTRGGDWIARLTSRLNPALLVGAKYGSLNVV